MCPKTKVSSLDFCLCIFSPIFLSSIVLFIYQLPVLLTFTLNLVVIMPQGGSKSEQCFHHTSPQVFCHTKLNVSKDLDNQVCFTDYTNNFVVIFFPQISIKAVQGFVPQNLRICQQFQHPGIKTTCNTGIKQYNPKQLNCQ